MRIDPDSGEILSNIDDCCPNCDRELNDIDYPYCDYCGEYVGVIYQEEYVTITYENGEEETITLNEYSQRIKAELREKIEKLKKDIEEAEKSGAYTEAEIKELKQIVIDGEKKL